MRFLERVSLPSFAAGVACASVLAGVPALAAIASADQSPTVFDGSAPALTLRPVEFAVGQSINAAEDACGYGSPMFNVGLPMMLRWDAPDTTSGTASYDVLTEKADTGIGLVLANTTATSLVVSGSNYHNDCGGTESVDRYWVTARDHRGNTATTAMTSGEPAVWDEAGVDRSRHNANIAVARTGTWSTSTCLCHNHNATTYSTAQGASLSYTINVDAPGRTVALVAPKSSSRGVMNISVDGRTATPVNTYAATTTNRIVVWQSTLNSGTHTIRITNAGTSGRSRIDVDTIMLGPSLRGEAPRVLGY